MLKKLFGKRKKKLGVALSSGAFRGLCHIGVLQALSDNNIKIDAISGCSMGAVIGGCVAAGMSAKELKEVFLSFKWTGSMLDINDFNPFAFGLGKGALYGNKINALLEKYIGDILIEDAKIPFCATAVNAKTGELLTFTSGYMRDVIRASISIPVVFRPASAGEYSDLIDGGVVERIPLLSARKIGADVVVGVDALGAPVQIDDFTGVLSVLERTFLIADWAKEKANVKNADVLIAPPMADIAMFDFKRRKEAIEEGYAAALVAIPKILDLLG